MKAAVLGAGSWGTTFAQVLCDAGTRTVLYARKPQLAKALAGLHENPDYLPGIALTPALDATSDPAEALDGADLVAFAVPAQSLRANLADWAPLLPPGALLVSLMKGIELGTRLRMSEVIAEVTGAGRRRGVAVVAGPNLAGEIVRREFTAAVVACCLRTARWPCRARATRRTSGPYTNTDVTGLRAGRRGEERDRDRGGHRGGDGARRQHQGHADHPGAGRDRQAGFGAGRADRRRSPGWPGWATWWPRAARRCPGTGRSASTWGGA